MRYFLDCVTGARELVRRLVCAAILPRGPKPERLSSFRLCTPPRPLRLIFAVYSGLEACMILYQFVLMGIMYAKNGKYAKFADPVRRAKYIKYINKARGAFVVSHLEPP